MLSSRFSVSFLVGSALLFDGASLLAQAYPSRPVRIVTAGIGGGNDFVARLIAQGISGPLGQPVIVDNRPGASSIPGTVVAQSQPDGHTVLIYGAGVWLSQFLRDDVVYDVERDFAPVSILDGSPLLLVVHPSMPVNSVKDLIAYAKAKPGALNFSTGGTGSSSHLSAELFMYMTGTKMVRIPYASGSQEIIDLVAGQVQLTFSTGAAAPHAKSGKLRPLAHTGDQPSTLYPGVPTVASAVPGYRAGALTGMFVPSKTPAAVIKRLNEETVRYLKTPEARERLFSSGTEPIGNTPEEARTAVRGEIARWGKVIKELGIKTN